MPSIAYVNGRFSSIEDAVVSVEDRGFQLGDGIYEVLRTYHGQLHAVEPHMRRLFRSLDAIELKHAFTAAGLEQIIREAVQRAGFDDSLVYLQITRGATKRTKEFPIDVPPTLVITVRKLELPPAAVREKGVAIQAADDIRWQRCDIKTVCLLPNVLASQRARAAGCFEALFVEKDGTVNECASANIFIVASGVVATPPLSARILGGITRDEVVALAHKNGVPMQERRVTLDELLAADEVFMTGTTVEVLPVVKVNDRPIAAGKPGPVTQRLHKLFCELAD
ncbi:MAG: D-amino acid aminotransferase [Verrucomicrobia bacterium]|nr:D-amino acid aminotransferase [Verrucomicrobiota bacterium]